MGNHMIDWGAVLFWQITDTDTAGRLSEEMGEWYMSELAQNQAKNAHILQGDIGTLETICVSAFIRPAWDSFFFFFAS